MLACRAAVRRGPSSLRSSVHGRVVSSLPPGRGAGYQVPGHVCSAPTCLVCTLKVGRLARVWSSVCQCAALDQPWGATRGASVRQSASDASAVAFLFWPSVAPRGCRRLGLSMRALCPLVHLGPTPLVLGDLRIVSPPWRSLFAGPEGSRHCYLAQSGLLRRPSVTNVPIGFTSRVQSDPRLAAQSGYSVEGQPMPARMSGGPRAANRQLGGRMRAVQKALRSEGLCARG